MVNSIENSHVKKNIIENFNLDNLLKLKFIYIYIYIILGTFLLRNILYTK